MLDTVIDLLSMGTNFERLLYGLWVTIKLSLISAIFSIIFGILFGLFMEIKNPITKIISQIYLQVIRIMPPLVLLFITYFGVTRIYGVHISAETSAIIVFTIWGTAEMGDLVRGSIESIIPIPPIFNVSIPACTNSGVYFVINSQSIFYLHSLLN